MNQTQTHRPIKLNLDKNPKYLGEDEASFILNSQPNDVFGIGGSGSVGSVPPVPANYAACSMNLPAGENYVVGSHRSSRTGELYSFVYNSNGVDFIQRLNPDGACQVVYYDKCFSVSAEPKHAIEKWRAFLHVEREGCANRHGKYLTWTDGDGEIGHLDVEAAIATNNFSTPFFDSCEDRCDFHRLCVPDPCRCIVAEFIPPSASDATLTNFMLNAGFKFAYRHVYYDGRRSIWSEPSSLYYQNTKECFAGESGFSRCMKLRIPVGNPMVEIIELAYWKDGVWRMYERIEKYKAYTSAQQYWYQRQLADRITSGGYSDSDCAFDYVFCNDRQCEKIDDADIYRVSNFMPRKPQGLFPLADGVAFYNYEKGACRIRQSEVDKFKISASYQQSNCEQEYCDIYVRAVIHNRLHNRNQFVYRLGGSADNAPDDKSDTAYFGGLNLALNGGIETGYDQSFREETRNFIAYIDGTDYYSEMKQYKSSAFFRGTKESWGVIPNMDKVATRNRWRRATRNGEFFYQEAVIRVPRGTRGFLRLASHKAVGNEQDTSTFVVGTQDLTKYKGDLDTQEGFASGEEIYVDTCGKQKVDLLNAFMIDDNAVDASNTKASAYNGYVKDKLGLPIEGAVVKFGAFEYTTDHNGFYHFWVYPGENDPIDVDILVERDCFSFSSIMSASILGEPGFNTRSDQTVEDDDYTNRNVFLANVPVVDCGGLPVGGVKVSVSGAKSRVTGADGIARFRLRNYKTRNRIVRFALVSDTGCFRRDCLGFCNVCMPISAQQVLPACSWNGTNSPVLNVQALTVNTDAADASRGLKAGGSYPFGFVVKGDCGQLSSVSEVGYVQVKKTQEKGSLGFPQLSYDARGITLPDWARCVYIVRGENTNQYELQWVVDKIERNSDGKLKLTIQSLNDYNERYFFKTNSVYKWLKGDRVEFVFNGDGTVFNPSTVGILDYLTISPFAEEQTGDEENVDADYFNQLVIDDDGRLNDLKKGAVIEIKRSRECQTETVYYTMCASIPVVNGKLVHETGTFDTFDTYLVARKIGEFPSILFEHHSPSDFWGDRISDIGRPYFVNKYETERRFSRNVTLASSGVPNYFGDYEKTMDCPEHGGIVAVGATDNSVILIISEHDNMLAQISDELLRVGNDGMVRASGELISSGQQKLAGRYGCSYDAIGSIHFGDGYALWVERTGAYVMHDYSVAKTIDEGKARRFFKQRVNQAADYNAGVTDPLSKIRYCTGHNRSNGSVYLTMKTLRDPAVNNSKDVFQRRNETIVFDPASSEFFGFVSFTPEFYGDIDIVDSDGSAFISFFGSIPYIHPVKSSKWNEFYGIACDRVITISINKFPDKRKIPLSVEVWGTSMWFVSSVKTEAAGFDSEIPAKRFEGGRGKWNAAFLYNKNNRGGLYGTNQGYAGERANSPYILVTFVRDNTVGLQYGSFSPAKATVYDSLDAIISKFMVVEQSGFTENL